MRTARLAALILVAAFHVGRTYAQSGSPPAKPDRGGSQTGRTAPKPGGGGASQGNATPKPQESQAPPAKQGTNASTAPEEVPACAKAWRNARDAATEMEAARTAKKSAEDTYRRCSERLADTARSCAKDKQAEEALAESMRNSAPQDRLLAVRCACGASAEKDPLKKLLSECKEALDAQQKRSDEADCKDAAAKSLYGLGPGHLNFLVVVGREEKVAAFPEQARSDCLAGKPIDQIGVSQRLANITRQEGFASSTTEGREELVSARPGDAILVMPVEYEAVFDGSTVVRKCTRPRYFAQAKTASVDLYTVPFPPTGDEGKHSLVGSTLDAELKEQIEFEDRLVIPIRKLIHFKQNDSDEIVMDGQDIVLRLTRTRTDEEKKHGGKGDIIQPSWHFLAADMPPWTLRAFPLFAVALDRPSEGGKPVTATGVAVALSYRWSYRNNYYMRLEPLVQLALRNGNDSAIPEWTMGLGAQLDLSGILGVGVSWVKNITWADRPVLMLTLVPASSLLKKLVDKPGLFAPK